MNFWKILVLIILGFNCKAQTYQPLLAESNEWHITTCYNGCITDVYTAHTDTLVGGNWYKVLDGFHYISRTFLLREDVTTKQVYLLKIYPTKNEEFLLYDFNLNVGDSIILENPLSPFPSNGGRFIVDSIVSKVIADGNNYRHFYLSPSSTNSVSSSSVVWIESVGSLSLINAPGGNPNINGAGQVSCLFKSGEIHYSQLDSISECVLNYDLGFNEFEESKFSIYPNPAGTFLNVALGNERGLLRIIDLNGKIIQTADLMFGETQLFLNFSKGVYFVQVIDENGLIYCEKLIKE